MDASKVEVGGKTYDMNFLGKAKKSNLRRKLIIEYIQNQPTGEYIKMNAFKQAGRFNTAANADAFVKRMVRDGIIQKHSGEKPRSYYYSVIGAIRVRKPMDPSKSGIPELPKGTNPDVNAFISDMQALGVQFTITISNKEQS